MKAGPRIREIADQVEIGMFDRRSRSADAVFLRGLATALDAVITVCANGDTAEPDSPQCGCQRCTRDRQDMVGGWPWHICHMILCAFCGNKRCPHARDHRNHCTGSNEPDQQGSNEAAA